MKRILYLSNMKTAAEARSSAMVTALQALFSPEYRMEVSSGLDTLKKETLDAYAFVISGNHADLMQCSIDFSAALIAYVAMGGGWLALQNGTHVRNDYGLTTVLGARTLAELPMQEHALIITSPDHPAMQGCEAFSLHCGAFQYAFSTIRPGPKQEKRALLFEYSHHQTVSTGGWAQSFGQGRVAGIALTFSAENFTHPTITTMFQNLGRWLDSHA